MEEEKVEVPKSLLESILKKQEEIEAQLSAKNEKIAQLEYAADKGRMGIYEQRNKKGELIRTYGVHYWPVTDPKTKVTREYMVRGTKLVDDDVAVEDNGGVRRLVERQTLRLFLDMGVDADGHDKSFKEVDIPYLSFRQRKVTKRFPVVKQSTTDEGRDLRTLRFDDGREVEFDIAFLN